MNENIFISNLPMNFKSFAYEMYIYYFAHHNLTTIATINVVT